MIYSFITPSPQKRNRLTVLAVVVPVNDLTTEQVASSVSIRRKIWIFIGNGSDSSLDE